VSERHTIGTWEVLAEVVGSEERLRERVAEAAARVVDLVPTSTTPLSSDSMS
jgi:hypothetical protein